MAIFSDRKNTSDVRPQAAVSAAPAAAEGQVQQTLVGKGVTLDGALSGEGVASLFETLARLAAGP